MVSVGYGTLGRAVPWSDLCLKRPVDAAWRRAVADPGRKQGGPSAERRWNGSARRQGWGSELGGAKGLAPAGRGQQGQSTVRAHSEGRSEAYFIDCTIVFVATLGAFILWFNYTAVRECDLYISISWK